MKYRLYFTLIICVIFALSCHENVINPIEEESGIYSFYGAIQVGESFNVVRVKDLNEAFLNDSNEFRGEVSLSDLETGNLLTLKDSIISYPAGYTHNFIIEDEIEHNKVYSIEAVRADGEKSQSIATTPGKTEINLNPQNEFYECNDRITFSFGNVVDQEFIDLRISAEYQGEVRQADMRFYLQFFEHDDDQDVVQLNVSPHNLLVEVFPPNSILNNPTLNPFTVDPIVTCNQLSSDTLIITYTHFGREWAPARPVIRGLLNIDSGDVIGGLGLFGSYYRNSIELPLAQ